MNLHPNRDNANNPYDILKPSWQPNEIIKMFHEERAKIDQRGRECKSLLTETDTVLAKAQTLRDLYAFISPKTSQLHAECKTLIQERNDLRESFEKINFTLTKQEELRSILKRMPEIKNQVFAILNAVSQSFQDSDSGQVAPLEDYYGRFFVECRRMKDLTLQLESCLTCANTEELTIYLEEIYRLYIDIREQLMVPVFTKNLDRLVEKANRNYCDLIQQSCATLARTMRNEIQLFQQVFPTKSESLQQSAPASKSGGPILDSLSASSKPETANEQTATAPSGPPGEAANIKKQSLRELLELFCKLFYEHLRPTIIHVNHLETLAELFKLINETIRLEFGDESFQSTMNALVEDIQERLVFRTEVFIQENILDYKPSQGDLAYPEKFELIPSGDLYDYQSMWYPTVQRTVLAMLYLKRVFDDLTFSELALELVAACYRSLDEAQHLVDERHGGSRIEASLFLSKHTAIIVNQMRIFGLDQSMVVPPSPLMASAGPDDNPPLSVRGGGRRRAPPAAAAGATATTGAARPAAAPPRRAEGEDAPKERARD